MELDHEDQQNKMILDRIESIKTFVFQLETSPFRHLRCRLFQSTPSLRNSPKPSRVLHPNSLESLHALTTSVVAIFLWNQGPSRARLTPGAQLRSLYGVYKPFLFSERHRFFHLCPFPDGAVTGDGDDPLIWITSEGTVAKYTSRLAPKTNPTPLPDLITEAHTGPRLQITERKNKYSHVWAVTPQDDTTYEYSGGLPYTCQI